MDDDDPNLITSGKSQRVVVDGYPFSIQIFRLESDDLWTLEVVDHKGTSHAWVDQFRSDREARDAALAALSSEGAAAFMRGDNIIPFSKR